MLRSVIQLLEENPQGLTTSQILDFAVERGVIRVNPDEGPKTPYFRVKRAVDSLMKAGFARQEGVQDLGGRPQKKFIMGPQAMDQALREVLRQALGNIEDRIRNQFPLSDATQLVAAFEEVLKEDAERLGLQTRKPRVSTKGLEIRK